MNTTTETKKNQARERVGIVSSDKMDKTVVVELRRSYRHPRYEKFVRERERVKAHDPENSAKVGDTVLIEETRPLSKDKRWRVAKVLERAQEQ